MMHISTIIAFLTLLACVSPLLTFVHLWQIKEWRIDRLREHMRSEGWLEQLFGQIRPIILLFGWLMLGITSLYVIMETNNSPDLVIKYISIGILAVFALVNLLQVIIRKQPFPIYTSKTTLIIITSILINTALSMLLINISEITGYMLITALVILQPFIVFIAWILLNPFDLYAKKRVRYAAKEIRKNQKDITVIGITGSVGKTTTKEILRHILFDKNISATPKYLNSDIGVARWIIKTLKANYANRPKILIVEMGAYRIGEIASLCDFIQPNIGVITAIGRQHLALFGSKEALCQAKGELVEAIPENGRVYLNADNEISSSLQSKAKCKVIKVGTGGNADIEAYDIEETGQGIRFRVGQIIYFVPLHGTHNVTNLLLGIAIAKDIGIQEDDIAKRLKTFAPPKQTFSVTENKDILVLNDTHNASTSSFRAAIAWAKTQPMEQKILLTNGLMELGEMQDTIHTEMGALAQNAFTRVIFMHKRNARFFEKGFGKPVELFSKKSESVANSSLLVCIGKIPESAINHLLPSDNKKL